MPPMSVLDEILYKMDRIINAVHDTVPEELWPEILRRINGPAAADTPMDEFEEARWSISPVGVRRIEDGERRVPVDDLLAFAVALGVSPATLLIPNVADGDEQVAVTGVTGKLDAERLWNWLRIEESDDPAVHPIKFQMVALPEWKRQQLLAHAAIVDVQFRGGGRLTPKPDAGEAQ